MARARVQPARTAQHRLGEVDGGRVESVAVVCDDLMEVMAAARSEVEDAEPPRAEAGAQLAPPALRLVRVVFGRAHQRPQIREVVVEARR